MSKPSVPLLDIHRENESLREEILAAIARVCDSGRFLHGPEVQQLEASIAEWCDVEHAVGCASGSDALLLALMALGIGPGDEVIVPSFTFFATASCVWRLGARPVFVDIEPTTFNIDPEAIFDAITPATKAIVPVHLFGQSADMERIGRIAARHSLKVIEDCAQAIGGRFEDADRVARPVGSWGDLGCFSFYPTKNLGGFGDGGILTIRDAELAERVRLFASHGMQPKYYHSVVGINSRLDSIQAAVLNTKLAHLAELTRVRDENARRYHELFHVAGLTNEIRLPQVACRAHTVWNQYTIRVPNGRRDGLRNFLQEHGISTEIYYPVPLHLQECFASLGHRPGSLPVTEKAAEEVLSLPIFPGLTSHEQHLVVGAMRAYLVQSPRLTPQAA